MSLGEFSKTLPYDTKVWKVSNDEVYICETITFGAALTDSKWRVQRVLNGTDIRYANSTNGFTQQATLAACQGYTYNSLT